MSNFNILKKSSNFIIGGFKNKWPMGHIAQLKQFQSINTFAQSYDHTIDQSFIYEKKSKLSPLQRKILCTKFGWIWPSGFREDF